MEEIQDSRLKYDKWKVKKIIISVRFSGASKNGNEIMTQTHMYMCVYLCLITM